MLTFRFLFLYFYCLQRLHARHTHIHSQIHSVYLTSVSFSTQIHQHIILIWPSFACNSSSSSSSDLTYRRFEVNQFGVFWDVAYGCVAVCDVCVGTCAADKIHTDTLSNNIKKIFSDGRRMAFSSFWLQEVVVTTEIFFSSFCSKGRENYQWHRTTL